MKKYVVFLLIICMAIVTAIIGGCKVNEEPEAKYYSVEYLASDGGTVSGEANQTVENGGNATEVVAVANTGYKFVEWSDGIETAERTDRNVTADISVTAKFERLSYTVRYITGDCGYIRGLENQMLRYGDDASGVTAIPNKGYKFIKWSDGIETAERADRNITANKTVTAIFEKFTYNMKYETDGNGYIVGKASQSVGYGENAAKVTAIPNNGYKFVKWSDGVESDVRQDLNVNENVAVTAEFEFLFESGNGERANPFIIKNYQQLLSMRAYPDQFYRLTNDLDLAGINHEPIFDDNEPFSGYFDGNGKTIDNLTVATEKNYPSLFGFIFDGIVSNLNLSNVDITTIDFNTNEAGTNYYVGTVAGYSVGFLNNILVDGKITVDGLTYDGVAVGGLAGMAYSTVADCVADMHITVRNVKREHETNMTQPFLFGGLLGVCDSAHIRNCNAQGEISVTNSFRYIVNGYGMPINEVTDICIGGLAGYYFTNRQADTEIKDSQTNIVITGDNHYKAGGFIGQLQVADKTSLNIVDNAVNGNITIGIAGGFTYNIYNDGELLIDNCYVENNITAFSSAAGFVLECFSYDKNLEITNCRTIGAVIVHKYNDTQIVVGEADGFSSRVQGVRLTNCYAKRNIKSSHSTGFSQDIYECNISACYYMGNIEVGGNGNKNFHGIGFAMDIDKSTVYDCFVNADISYERVERLNGFARYVDNSEIKNFYVVGQCDGELIYEIENSTISNGHVLRDSFGVELPAGIDINIYENLNDMFYLAEKLNGGNGNEIWVNVENALPQFKFYIC